ncbi:unnamed protein product [Calypogeia fissa]
MSFELHVLHAAADGVQPALLLRSPGKKAEYLFNVPDGFSRLALEQKLIPSARLSCVLLTSLLPESTGGFGGLFLRLKHDGHGQVQVIGPQGSSSIIHSLRHICRWQHPKVFVSECCESQRPVPVFEDEYVVIVPLVAGDHLTGCPWCLYKSSESSAVDPVKKKVPLATTVELSSNSSSSSSDCSGSGSDFSSDDTASTGLVPSNSGTDGDSFEKSLRQFRACSDVGKNGHGSGFDVFCKADSELSNGVPLDSTSHFCHIQMDGRDFKEVLRQQRKRGAGNYPLLVDSDEEMSGQVRDELPKAMKLKRCEASFRGSGDVNCLVLGSTSNPSLLHYGEGRAGLDNFTGNGLVDETELLPGGASGGELLKSSIAESTKPYEWRISNFRRDDLPQLEDDSNPVYGLNPSTQAQVISRVEIENDPKVEGNAVVDGNPARVLGYVAYLRKLNTAVLVVDCGGTEDLETLVTHPALSCIYCTSGSKKDDETKMSGKIHSVSATIHLTPHSLVQSREYQLWMASLGNPTHVVMDESSPEFGFQSSLALLQRLNSVQGVIFPLPFKMVDSNYKNKQFTQELTNSKVTIVDARHSLCLRICEEGTTWSYVSVDNSVHPLTSNKISSIGEPAKQLQPELLSGKKAEVPRSNASTCSYASPNALAAIEIKRRLLQQKDTILSSGIVKENKETLPIDNTTTLCQVMNCTKQDCVCRTYVLPLTTKGNQDGSAGFSHNEDDYTCADGGRSFNADNELATPQVLLKDNQATTSLMKVSRNCEIVLPQTRDLTPVQEYAKFHDPVSEFQLVFLGTGCAEPSKKRGSSSILLQVRGAQGAMLLDAGEGAAGQLFRRFGEQAARTIISSLQCLWLSHKHGDHVLGVLSILQKRFTQAAPLVIIGPQKVGQWLSEVRNTCSTRGYHFPQYTFIHCEELSKSEQHFQNSQQDRKQLLEVLDAMQLNSMLSVKVFHCHEAYGIIFNGRQGWKVAYSGDTRPCKQLIEAGHGCTVLIHEATFEDTLVEQAKSKRHSTVSEAIKVGWEMRAQHIILTHFSQRYPEMVVINGGSNENLSVAFDGMVVPSQSLHLLGKLLPQIRIACQKTVSSPPMTGVGVRRCESTSERKPVLHGESLPAVKMNSSKEPLVATHKRWSSDSDDEANGHSTDHRAISTLTWSSDSDHEAELNQQGGLLTMRNGSRSSFTGIVIRTDMQSTPLENLSKLDGPSSYIRETTGPLGGKHVRWIDSDDG